jgi:RNase P/RNase MRP subunit p29
MEGVLVGVDVESIPIRGPAIPKRVSELRAGDERVRVVGMVVNKGESEFVLDDGSGQLTVLLEDPSLVVEIGVGSKVRVFGSPMEAEGGIELHADILQKADSLDLKLYEEVREEEKKLEARLRGE